MEITQTTVELKTYTPNDRVCFQTPEGTIVGDIENFDVHQRTFTLRTQDGTYLQVDENRILASIDSAPFSPPPQAAPTTSPSIGARTFQFNNYPGGNTNVYDNSTHVTVNVGYGGNANLYFRSSTITLPPPPIYVKCTDCDKFWAIWASFYQNNSNYSNYTGVPTTVIRPGTLITTTGNVQVFRN